MSRTGVAKINHALSKGTYGYNQVERNSYIQNNIIAVANQLEADLLSSLNSSKPNETTFSQNTKNTSNSGGQSTSSGSVSTAPTSKTAITTGPQVVFEDSSKTTAKTTSSSSSTSKEKLDKLKEDSGSKTQSQLSNNTSMSSSNQNSANVGASSNNTSSKNAIANLINTLFKIGGSNVLDPIKNIKGFYYVIENDKLIFFKAKDIVSKILTINLQKSTTSKSKKPFLSTLNNDNGFISTAENYIVKFDVVKIKELIKQFFPKIASDSKKLEKFIDAFVLEAITYLNINMFNKTYEDYSFSYQTPFNSKELSNTNFGNSLVYNVSSEYNFYTKNYEESTLNSLINERVYPNLYIYTDQEVQEQKRGFKLNHATLNKRIALKNIDDEYYYTNWSISAEKIKTPNSLDSISLPLINTIYQKKDFGRLQDKNLDRELFPMFSSIEFSMTNADMQIVEELNSSVFTVPLYNKISEIIPNASTLESISGFFNPTANEAVTDSIRIVEQDIRVIEKPGLNDVLVSHYTSKDMRVVSFDLFNVISSSIQNVDNTTIPKRRGIDILNYLSDVQKIQDSPLFRIIEPLKIKGKIKNIIDSNVRTYDDFIKNTDLIDSETLFYRISKFRIAIVNGAEVRQYVQSYTVPNFQDVTKFIQYDTQLRYDTRYEYVVSAYQVVIGTEYQFTKHDNSTNKNLLFNAITCPILKLVETPYFTKRIYVKDSAPIEPDVRIVFFKDVSNVIKFLFNAQVGLKYAMPISIDSNDKNMFSKLQEAQETKGKLKFETEDPPSYFEIFRLEDRPTNILDFSGFSKFKVLPKFASYSGDFVDIIEPNKKYYYLFRVADIHQHTSNPTQCFEVEIVNDNGKIFPIINIIKLEEEVIDNKVKSLKRFLHIKPSIIQRQIRLKNEQNESTALNNGAILGSESDSLWGKTLKVRIKSKLSNKVVDFNITFDKKHIISKDEKELTS